MEEFIFSNFKIKQMNIYEYTSWNNRAGSEQIVRKYGLQPIAHPTGLAKQLSAIVTQVGQPALDDISEIHPDNDLLRSRLLSTNPVQQPYSNIDGQSIKREVAELVNNGRDEGHRKTELLIIGGFTVLALALILKK